MEQVNIEYLHFYTNTFLFFHIFVEQCNIIILRLTHRETVNKNALIVQCGHRNENLNEERKLQGNSRYDTINENGSSIREQINKN